MEEQIIFKLPADKKDEAVSLAKKRGMDLSNFLRNILYREIEEDSQKGQGT